MGDVVFYPDIASYQAGMSLAGLQVVCVKATEDGGEGPGSRYVNPDYARAAAEARARGETLIAYHYLHGAAAGADPVMEADFAYSIIGAGVPVMLDVEAYGATVADCLAFAAELRRRGGNPRLAYLPRWYWDTNLHQADLRPLTTAGLHVVSSNYPTGGYSDSGPGWDPYGGVAPIGWQYTDRASVNGHLVDMNAYRGSLAQFRALLSGGPMTDPISWETRFPAAPSVKDGAGNVLQRSLVDDVRGTASILFDGVTVDGDVPAGFGVLADLVAKRASPVVAVNAATLAQAFELAGITAQNIARTILAELGVQPVAPAAAAAAPAEPVGVPGGAPPA